MTELSRRCRYCDKLLVRKRFPGGTRESEAGLRSRLYCGQGCRTLEQQDELRMALAAVQPRSGRLGVRSSAVEEVTRTQFVADSRSARGAASELIACSELMKLGFYVFRCEAPAAPFDLVAYAGGRCLRVEVKSITYPPRPTSTPTFAPPTNTEWDLIVIVGDGECFIYGSELSVAEIRDDFRGKFGFPPIREVCRTRRRCHEFAAAGRTRCDACESGAA